MAAAIAGAALGVGGGRGGNPLGNWVDWLGHKVFIGGVGCLGLVCLVGGVALSVMGVIEDNHLRSIGGGYLCSTGIMFWCFLGCGYGANRKLNQAAARYATGANRVADAADDMERGLESAHRVARTLHDAGDDAERVGRNRREAVAEGGAAADRVEDAVAARLDILDRLEEQEHDNDDLKVAFTALVDTFSAIQTDTDLAQFTRTFSAAIGRLERAHNQTNMLSNQAEQFIAGLTRAVDLLQDSEAQQSDLERQLENLKALVPRLEEEGRRARHGDGELAGALNRLAGDLEDDDSTVSDT